MTKQSIYRSIKRGSILLAVGIWVLPSISSAQHYYDPGLLQKTVDRKPVDYQSPGVRIGAFDLQTGAELAMEKNDNIFYLDNLEVSDRITHFRPWLNLNSNWSRHMLNFSAYADLGYYNDHGEQDYKDWVASLNGRIDVRRKSAFNYKASYMQLHQDRSSPEGRFGVGPTTYDLSGIDLDYKHSFNRMSATLGYKTQDIDYDDNLALDGSWIDNQDRDRARNTWTVRMDYDYSELSSVFVSYADNTTNYDETFDSNGFMRSSDGYDVRGGASWNMTGKVTGDLYVQYINQKYDDPRFEKLSGFGIGANLDWTPTELTSVNVKFANTPQETIQVDTSGYYSSLYSARVQHELRRNFLLNARVSYTDNDYEYNGTNTNALTDTEVTRAGLGMSYLFNRHWYLSGGYIYEKQDANTTRYQYRTNRWFLTLGGEI